MNLRLILSVARGAAKIAHPLVVTDGGIIYKNDKFCIESDCYTKKGFICVTIGFEEEE